MSNTEGGGDCLPHDDQVVRVPVARSRSMTRSVLWWMPAIILAAVAWEILRSLNFHRSAVSSRLVDYSVAVVALPIVLAALVCAFHGVRWALLAVWPGRLGVYAERDALVLRLGPFGVRRYDLARLEVRYPFESLEDADAEDADFEAYLPVDEQMATLLPRITHPNSDEPLNWVVLRFVSGPEAGVAATLRPAIARWRESSAGTVKQTDAE